ncbi:hypothetical protein LWI28_021082 [Acer negundo]|uniref:Uncharacterized protein n=1 Tax=Acer negundo TaxID=4023 RepID=A0AAD5JUI6_ACENE|nr:hypothetical protein LWI28_021082 [Acer negundo]
MGRLIQAHKIRVESRNKHSAEEKTQKKTKAWCENQEKKKNGVHERRAVGGEASSVGQINLPSRNSGHLERVVLHFRYGHSC